jgi:hypothetical protein
MTRTRSESADKQKFMVMSWDESDQHYCQVKPRAGKIYRLSLLYLRSVHCHHHKVERERTFPGRNCDCVIEMGGQDFDNHDFDGRHTRA